MHCRNVRFLRLERRDVTVASKLTYTCFLIQHFINNGNIGVFRISKRLMTCCPLSSDHFHFDVTDHGS